MSKMSAQHTPGPWMAAAINSPRIAFVVTPKPRAIGGSRITGTVATVPSHEAADESAANARLIAAAPGLLAALIAVRDDLNTTIGEGAEVRDVSPEVQALIDAAIAAARGGQS